MVDVWQEDGLGNKMKLKIMSYNIMNGFYDNIFGNPNPKIQPERKKAVKTIVSEYKPDILIVPEVCGFKENPKVKISDYQKIFGKKQFPYIGYGDTFQDGVFGVAILSKYPMKTEDLSEKGRGLIRAHIKLPNGVRLTVDGIHLIPSESYELSNKRWPKKNYAYRNSKAKGAWIKKKTSGLKGNRIIAGDFNALSPQDKYNKGMLIKGINSLPHSTLKSAKWKVNDLLKSSEIKAVLGYGLQDTYKLIHPKGFDYTLPTKLDGSSMDSAQRIDYIFCSPQLNVIDSGIIKESPADVASDHYPVYADVEI